MRERRCRCRRHAAKAVLLVVVALGAGVTAAEASSSGANGVLSFSADQVGGRAGIFNLATTGRLRRQPGTGPLDSFPLWSPDGRQLAFSRLTTPPGSDADSSETEVWVMAAGGGGARRVSDVSVSDPCGATPMDTPSGWSPDSLRLLFVSTRWDGEPGSMPPGGQQDCANGTLWTTAASGGEPAEIGGGPQGGCTNITAARWSPDGSQIAYAGQQQGCTTQRLFVSDADGTNRRRLTTGAGDVLNLDWSPNGRRIAYALSRGTSSSATSLYVVGVDGTGRRKIARGCDQPAWSPDARRIACAEFERVLSVAPDGTRRRVLLAPGRVMNVRGLSWQPRRK